MPPLHFKNKENNQETDTSQVGRMTDYFYFPPDVNTASHHVVQSNEISLYIIMVTKQITFFISGWGC